MSKSWEQVAERVFGTLSDKERKSSVVYLDERVIPAGAPIGVGGREVTRSWPAVVAFVDLEPCANWAHACRYLLVHAETGEIESIDARMPPFVRQPPPTFEVIWKAESVPAWAVLGE